MFVRDCMTPNPTTIEPEAHLDDALGIMRALKVRHLPVLQGLRLVGILTWTDLMRAAPSSAAPLQAAETPSLLRRMRVKEVMTPDPITVSPDEPVEVAARLLREHKIGSLPVVEHRMLAGIVTQTDLFDALIHLLGGDIRGVRVSIDLPNGLADLTALAGVLTPLLEARSGALTLSVRIDATSRRGYVRVRTSAPLILAEQLAVAGLEVSHLRLDPPAKPTRALS